MRQRENKKQIEATRRHLPWKWLGMAVLVLGLVVLVVSRDNKGSSSKAIKATQGATAKPTAPVDFDLVKFSPRTEAEKELASLLQKQDAGIDLALANWLIVADLPEFKGMSRETYFAYLNALTERVRLDMEKMRASGWKGADPKDPASPSWMFCSAIQRLRLSYTEQFRQENLTDELIRALYSTPDSIFLAGLLRTQQGSCVSMPLIYLVVGKKLGLPVHLVAVGRHYFIRWESADYRINIETTSTDKIMVTDDDTAYLEAEGKTKAEGNELQNLTNREVVGNLFFARSGYKQVKGLAVEAELDLLRAYLLAPEDPSIKASHQDVSNRQKFDLPLRTKSKFRP